MPKSLLALAAAAALAACGGGSKATESTTPEEPAPSESPAPPAPCVAMSQHMRDMVVRAGQEDEASPDLLAKLGPIIERIVGERCEADAWSPDVIACVNAADHTTMDPCIEKLGPDQEKALEEQIERDLAPVIEAEAAAAPQ